ncbi:MAG: LptF/LptG family permease [Opitutae bacterium]|nr:LptF/LptG family permease [Opitutae bacterium]
MLILDRYLFSTWLKHFLIITGFFLALLVAKEAYNHFVDLIRAGFGITKIFDFIIVSIFADLFVLIPITLFVSIIFTFIALQKSNQITILKSCGLSLFRISTPFYIVGTVIAILSYFTAALFIPSITDKRNTYLEILGSHTDSQNSIDSSEILTYQNEAKNRLWFIEAFNAVQLKGAYTILHQMNDAGIEIGRIIAQKCTYDNDLETWTFFNGTEVRFDENNGDPLQSISFKTKQFIDLEENPRDFLLLDKEISQLSFTKVKHILFLLPSTSQQRLKYEIRYYSFFATPLLSIILVGISIPFLTRGMRNNPINGAFCAFILLISFFITKTIIFALGLNYGFPALLTAFLPYFIYLILSVRLLWQK